MDTPDITLPALCGSLFIWMLADGMLRVAFRRSLSFPLNVLVLSLAFFFWWLSLRFLLK